MSDEKCPVCGHSPLGHTAFGQAFCSSIACKWMAPLIQDSGDRRNFPTGAVRDMSAGKGRMDLLPWTAIMELSKHCERGAIKYQERNIDKGLPISSLMDSAFRHMAKYMEGHKDEDHLLAAFWNLAWAVQFEVTKPEMQNIPARMEGDDGKNTAQDAE